MKAGPCKLILSGRPRFGSVAVWGWNGSSGSGFRLRRFLFKKGFSVFQYSLTSKNGSGSGFGSWKTVPAVPVPLSVSGKTVPTVPVSGSGSVPEPPCIVCCLMHSSWEVVDVCVFNVLCVVQSLHNYLMTGLVLPNIFADALQHQPVCIHKRKLSMCKRCL